jgi:hypothetical protein
MMYHRVMIFYTLQSDSTRIRFRVFCMFRHSISIRTSTSSICATCTNSAICDWTTLPTVGQSKKTMTNHLHHHRHRHHHHHHRCRRRRRAEILGSFPQQKKECRYDSCFAIMLYCFHHTKQTLVSNARKRQERVFDVSSFASAAAVSHQEADHVVVVGGGGGVVEVVVVVRPPSPLPPSPSPLVDAHVEHDPDPDPFDPLQLLSLPPLLLLLLRFTTMLALLLVVVVSVLLFWTVTRLFTKLSRLRSILWWRNSAATPDSTDSLTNVNTSSSSSSSSSS